MTTIGAVRYVSTTIGRETGQETDTDSIVGTVAPPERQAPPAAPARPSPPQPAADGAGNSWIGPLCILIVGMFMSVLDTSIVNIAIPRLQTALSASVDDIEWVVTGYTLVLGVVVPLTGWLGLRLGLTRLYLISMAGFTLGSALCGFAWSLPSMIAFRVVQAIPGGILPVVTMTLLFRIVPRDKIGTAMGLYGLGVVVAPAIGPTLGGALVEYFDWRLIFFINVPVGIIGIALAMVFFPQIRPTTWPKLDVLGFVTIAYSLFAILLAFSEGEDWGWTGYRILGLFVSSALMFGLFLVIENEVDNPLIDLKVFRSGAFCISLVLIGIAMTSLFSALYFLPQFLQGVQGLQELDSGLVLLPGSLVLVVLMPLAGRLYDAVGPRYPVMIGLVIVAFGSYLMARIGVDTPRSDIEWWLAVRNLGVGLCMMPIITAGTSALPGALTAVGSSVNNIVQRLASSVAIAVFGSLNTAKAAQLEADRGAQMGLDPYTTGQLVGPTGGAGVPTHPTTPFLGAYQDLMAQVQTQTYANGFYVVAILALVGAGVAVLMRSGRKKSEGGGPAHAVEL
jgi:EmrB/QacA subfamily drug resistance transporter